MCGFGYHLDSGDPMGSRRSEEHPIPCYRRMFSERPVSTLIGVTRTDGSLPYYFPKWSDRVGARYLNPWMQRIAASLPGFAVVEHIGRRSGTPYATPVSVFRRGTVLAVVLLHGETNWAKNVVAAGQAVLRYRGDTVTVRNPRIIAPREAGSDVPRIARVGNRIAGIIVFDAL